MATEMYLFTRLVHGKDPGVSNAILSNAAPTLYRVIFPLDSGLGPSLFEQTEHF